MSPLNLLILKIRTALLARKKSIFIKKTKMNLSIISNLYNFGLINSYIFNSNTLEIEVILKYINNESLIKDIKRISLPSRRIFCSVSDLKQNFLFKRLDLIFLSTPLGILSKQEAISRNVGGEPLFFISI